LNERLFVSGYLKEYELALKKKNKERVVEILSEVRIDEKSISVILYKHGMV